MTVCFDEEGRKVEPEGVCAEYDTGCSFPTFAIVKPAVENTRVDMSPYGQSIFADAIDAIQAVDVAFDAMITEVDISKMRVFLSDVLFDREKSGDKSISIPFGRQDCTVFRKVMSTEDTIQEFAPALRTNGQIEAFRVALQMLGDLTGFGISYFDFDCYADGRSCEASYYRDDAISVTLSAGRKAKGTVTFEVPEDATVVEVEYLTNYWTSNRVVFDASKPE